MNQLKKIFTLALISAAFVACNDDKSPVYDYTAAPELAPLEQPALVLTEAAQNFIAETFSWTSGQFGFEAAPLYVLQVDNTRDFTDPISLAESTNNYVSVNVGKLNTATIILGGSPGKPLDLFVRLQVKLTNKEIVYSAPTDMQVTPYQADIDFPKLYVPGSYQGWDIGNAPYLTSLRMNNKFEGYLNMVIASSPNDAISFKFTTVPAWNKGDEYGSGGAPLTLKLKGGDLTISPQGYYLMMADLNTLTYKPTPISSFSVVGSALNNGGQDLMLEFNKEKETWENSVSLVPGNFRFRANKNWEISYGDGDLDFKIDNIRNNDISVTTAGNYLVRLNLKKAPYSYELIQQ